MSLPFLPTGLARFIGAVLAIAVAGAAVPAVAASPLWGATSVTPASVTLPGTAADAPPSAAVRQVAGWIVATHDNKLAPFIVVDKVDARLFLFDADGTQRASIAVLFGLAHGDDSPPGIGSKPLSAITPAERITPAGRFVGEPGRSLSGKDILWLDYDAAIALHRASDVKPGATVRSRVDRLSSRVASDRRISLGCVNVSTAFYDTFIATFGQARGVVYILPETRPASIEFKIPAAVLAAIPGDDAARGS